MTNLHLPAKLSTWDKILDFFRNPLTQSVVFLISTLVLFAESFEILVMPVAISNLLHVIRVLSGFPMIMRVRVMKDKRETLVLVLFIILVAYSLSVILAQLFG